MRDKVRSSWPVLPIGDVRDSRRRGLIFQCCCGFSCVFSFAVHRMSLSRLFNVISLGFFDAQPGKRNSASKNAMHPRNEKKVGRPCTRRVMDEGVMPLTRFEGVSGWTDCL